MGVFLWPLPRSTLEAQALLPLPHHREQEFVLFWGTKKEHPHFILVGGSIELPISPTVGRQKPRSCTPLQAVALEGPACQFLVLCVPRGRGRLEEGTWDGGGVAGGDREGWLPALEALCPFLGPGLGSHLHLHHICQTLIKAPASPILCPLCCHERRTWGWKELHLEADNQFGA